MIDADGRIMLPMLGALDVAGRNLDAVRDQIVAALQERRLMQEPDVLVELAAYRPVYVGGAVASPGTIEFTPGLTVRQAIVSAGGVGRDMSPQVLIEAMAESRAIAFALAQIDARIARIEAELENVDRMESASDAMIPEMSVETGTEVLQLESELMRDRRSLSDADVRYKETLLQLLAFEIDVLERQSKLQTEEAEVQAEELTTARSLVDRGLMPRSEVQELLREKSQLSRDLLSNQAAMARARQATEATRFELLDNQTRTRIELRQDLQAALRDRAREEARLQAQRARLLASGVPLSTDGRVAEPSPSVTIFRSRGEEEQRIQAALGFMVEPGDVVQVVVETMPGDRQDGF